MKNQIYKDLPPDVDSFLRWEAFCIAGSADIKFIGVFAGYALRPADLCCADTLTSRIKLFYDF